MTDLKFEANEQVLCFHGPLLYEAKVLKAEHLEEEGERKAGPHYFVHYKGWKQTWDEWVPETRILKFSEENLKRQKELTQTLKSKKAKESKKLQEKEPAEAAKDRGKKRPREEVAEKEKEEEFLSRPEVRIAIPESLKVQLVEDWENVTKNHRLVRVPREVTVADILARYKESTKEVKGKKPAKESATDEVLTEVLDGIRVYFDRSLANLLLYRFERQQYVDIRKKYPDTTLSEVYGAEHLLRLFVQFPSLIAHTDMEPDAVGLLKDHFTKILEYLQLKQQDFFLSDYDNVSPTYIAQMKASG
ncbi:Esa1p-associated factor, partial [Thoreauomyces humboldtii]